MWEYTRKFLKRCLLVIGIFPVTILSLPVWLIFGGLGRDRDEPIFGLFVDWCVEEKDWRTRR